MMPANCRTCHNQYLNKTPHPAYSHLPIPSSLLQTYLMVPSDRWEPWGF